jgi:hypothetical protein
VWKESRVLVWQPSLEFWLKKQNPKESPQFKSRGCNLNFEGYLECSNEQKFMVWRTDYRSVGWVLCGETYLHRFKSSTWHRCSHFLGFILGFNSAMLRQHPRQPWDVCGDFAQFFRGARRDRVCVLVFTWVSACMLWTSCVILKKKIMVWQYVVLLNRLLWVGVTHVGSHM